MRTLAKCLCLALAVILATGCSKKVSEENAKKVQMGMTLAEVKAILGSGRKDAPDVYEWTTEKGGKLRISFTDDKVSRVEQQGGAPRVETDEEKAAQKAKADATDAMWADQKKESDRRVRDRDRIDLMNTLYVILSAASGLENRLPADEAAAAASPLAGPNPAAMEAIRTGRVVVRWGAATGDPVWAYEKDAPAKGGYAVGVKHFPAELLTAEKLRQLLKP